MIPDSEPHREERTNPMLNPDSPSSPSTEAPPENRERWSVGEALDYVDGIGTEYGRQLSKVDADVIRLGLSIGDGLHELSKEIQQLSRRIAEHEQRLNTLEPKDRP